MNVKENRSGRVVALVAPSPNAPSLNEQIAGFDCHPDLILRFDQSPQHSHVMEILTKNLSNGDTLLLWSTTLLPVSVPNLTIALHQLRLRGISIRIMHPGVKIAARSNDQASNLLAAMSDHEGFYSAMRAKERANKRARSGPIPRIDSSNIAEVREKLKLASPTIVAKSLGVSRSTLYNALKKFG